MFDISEFRNRDSALYRHLLSLPEESDFSSVEAEFCNPVKIRLPKDVIDVIGMVIEKYSNDYTQFINDIELESMDETFINSSLTSSYVLRVCCKLGFKVLMKRTEENQRYTVFNVLNDFHKVIYGLMELMYEYEDDNIVDVIDYFGRRMESISKYIERYTYDSYKIKSFRPFPTWHKAISKKSDEWHLNTTTFIRIVVAEALSTEFRFPTYYKYIRTYTNAFNKYCIKTEPLSLISNVEAKFIKSVLCNYSSNIYDIVKKLKTDCVRNEVTLLMEGEVW